MQRVKKSEQHQSLETLAVLATFLLILNLGFPKQAFVYIALGLLLVGLFVTPVARLVSLAWLSFASRLGAINSKVVLFLVFFVFLTPLAFLFRLFAKNPLHLQDDHSKSSLYVERGHLYVPSDFEKMW